MKDFKSLVENNVEAIYPSKLAFENKLNQASRLTIYLGVDPSSPQIHLGHSILLRKLAQFQELGHEVILLIGDFTGMIGDPTGKDKARVPLTQKQVLDNSKSYQAQAEKILRFTGKNPAKIKYNGAWLSKLTFKDLIDLASKFTVQQMIERDMFQARLEQKRPIGLHEFFYPLMQGYDSVAMKVDVEIGGTDQTFNMLLGRELVKTYLHKEKFVLTTPLLPGLDGAKMSKSVGNTVPIDTDEIDMFGKLMSLKDNLIIEYYRRLTNKTEAEVNQLAAQLNLRAINPMLVKIALAEEITSSFYGSKAGKEAKTEFERVFQKGQIPNDTPTISLDIESSTISVIDLVKLTKLTPSTSAANRLIEQGGVEIDNKIYRLPKEQVNLTSKKELLVKIGKRSFLKVKRKN